MCHLDTAQCRILKDSGRFLIETPRGLGLNIECVKSKTSFEYEEIWERIITCVLMVSETTRPMHKLLDSVSRSRRNICI